MHLTEEQAKRVIVRASDKKPEGFNIRTHWPNVVFERKIAIQKRISVLHSDPIANPRGVRYQLRLGQSDVMLVSKVQGETGWRETDVSAVGGVIPPLKMQPWDKDKEKQEKDKYNNKRKHSEKEYTPEKQPPKSQEDWNSLVEQERMERERERLEKERLEDPDKISSLGEVETHEDGGSTPLPGTQ